MRDFNGNRQPFEHADIRATRTANRNHADGGSQRAQNNADSLTEDLHCGARAQANFQHQPVRANMGYNMALAKDVGGFEVLERVVLPVGPVETFGFSHLAFKGILECRSHGLPPLQFDGHALARGDWEKLHLASGVSNHRACSCQPKGAHHSRHDVIGPTGSSAENALKVPLRSQSCHCECIVIPPACSNCRSDKQKLAWLLLNKSIFEYARCCGMAPDKGSWNVAFLGLIHITFKAVALSLFLQVQVRVPGFW